MSGYRILIIDDDPTQHLIVGEYLKQAGYQAFHAREGVKGIEMLDEKKTGLGTSGYSDAGNGRI
ncbi:MAG: response regulator [Desulfobacteraceae bacterium]|nr:response regulator [Desulfobacteraceae bacterium]